MLTEEHFNEHALTVGHTFEYATNRAYMDVSHDMNQNLKAHQRGLVMWHQKWAHCDLGRVQTLIVEPLGAATDQLIKPKHDRESSCPKHKCVYCCLSKTDRSSASTTTVMDSSDRNLNDDVLNPGDVFHLDQYMHDLPGCLPHTFEKEKPKARFTGGTIFVDGKTGFIHHQVSLHVGEMLKGNNTFEKGAAQFGVEIHKFKAYNAPFSSV
jgi:hypothetical protein